MWPSAVAAAATEFDCGQNRAATGAGSQQLQQQVPRTFSVLLLSEPAKEVVMRGQKDVHHIHRTRTDSPRLQAVLDHTKTGTCVCNYLNVS